MGGYTIKGNICDNIYIRSVFFLFELINVQTFENFIKSDLGVAYIVTCDCIL